MSSYDLPNTVINDLLCFLTSARDSLSHDNIIVNAVAFYKSDSIKSAKEIIFRMCDERNIARKSSASNPNPSVPDVRDILLLLEKVDEKSVSIPDFVAQSYASLPPACGFEALASVMCALRDELAAVRTEISELRQNTVGDKVSLEEISCVKQDVSDIKRILNSRQESDTRETNLSNASATISAPNFTSETTEKIIVPTRRKQQNKVIAGAISKNVVSNPVQTGKPPSNSNTSGWHVVGWKPSAEGSGPKVNIQGRKKDSNSGLAGVERVVDVFVGGCKVDRVDTHIIEL